MLGASGFGEEEAEKRENLDWSSFNCEALAEDVGTAGLGFEDAVLGGGRGVFSLEPPPMPNPGTETPAELSRLRDPWFRMPLCASGSFTAFPYVGGGVGAEGPGCEFCLGGNRGGRPGGFGRSTGGGIRPSAPSFLPGGGGRFEVDSPVVSARKGTGGPFGFAASASSLALSSSSALCLAVISSFGIGAPQPPRSGVI